MPLILHELIHFSLSIATAYFFSKTYNISDNLFFYLSCVALLGGFFIDIDHLFDYVKAFGFKFSLKQFFSGKQFEKNKKIYVLFHGYEYCMVLIIGALLYTEGVVQASIITFAVSSLFHLLADTQINNVLFLTYSIIFRIRHNFNIKKLTP